MKTKRLLRSKSGTWAAPVAALLLLFAVPSLRARAGWHHRRHGRRRRATSVRSPAWQVAVAGTTGKDVLTDASGRFKLTGLTGPTVVLNVRFLGFRPRDGHGAASARRTCASRCRSASSS